MAIFSIRNFAIKQLMKRGDDGIMKMPSNMKADFAEAMLTKQLIDAGIDPRLIKNEKQLVNVLDGIDDMNRQMSEMAIKESKGIMKSKKADVFNLQGEKLNPNKPIMGGTQEGKKINREFFERNAAAQTDVNSFIQGIKSMDPIEAMKEANKVIKRDGKYKNLTGAEAKKILNDTEDHIFQRDPKPGEFDPDIEDFQTGGRVGFNKGSGEVSGTFGVLSENADISKIIDQKVRDYENEYMKKTGELPPEFYGDKYRMQLQNEYLMNKKADGGRIGLKDGMDRRTFMKVMAGLASIPILGKFFRGAKVASKAAPVAEKMVGTSTEAPTYFLKLVDKITKQGKPVTSTEDIMETYIYTAKNGDSYELVNDLKTGDLRITKDKTGIGTYGDKSFDTIQDRTVLEYKAPRQDVDVETGRGTKQQGEYEEYKVEFDQDGTEAGADAIEELVQKEIIEESAEEAPSIKKADGGRVGLLSGGGILRTILTNLAKDKGMKPSEYLRLTNYKSLPDSTKRMISKDEFLKLKSDMTEKRVELMDTVKEMIVSRQGFEKSKADLAASMNKASPGYGDKAVEMMFPPGSFKSPVPAGSGQKDVMMMEQLIKNLKTKDRQLNASGGVAYMLGE
jgi:hypothetical protein